TRSLRDPHSSHFQAPNHHLSANREPRSGLAGRYDRIPAKTTPAPCCGEADMGVSMPLLSSTATVGREAEQALLSESLARAAAGAAHAVLRTGNAVIGKPRLLAEMAATAIRCNALVLRGRGTEVEGLPPYLMFLEALRPFIASAAGRALRRRLRRRAAAA